MKYTYTVVYNVKGIEQKPPDDLELVADEKCQIRAVLTQTPDKYDSSLNDTIAVFPRIADWLEKNNSLLLVEELRKSAATSRPKSKDAPHIVIQISGERPDLDGREIIEADNYVVHLNPNDPSGSIHDEGECTIAAILVSLVLESGGTITFNRIWDSIEMVRGDGKRTIPFNMSISTEIASYDSLTDDSPARITNSYRRLSSDKKTFGTILRLLKLSLENDKDKLRSFIFAWTAIEIFVNRVFKQYEKAMFSELGGDSRSELRHSLMERIRHMMKDKKCRYELADKFTIMAIQLCTADAGKDTDAFQKAKKVRNELFHESNIDETLLPIMAVRGLLVKYLQLHLGEILRPKTEKKAMRIAGRFDPSRNNFSKPKKP